MYDFDTVYDRKCSNSVKHAFHGDHGYSEDVIPMWVADMDFFKDESRKTAAVFDPRSQSVAFRWFGLG